MLSNVITNSYLKRDVISKKMYKEGERIDKRFLAARPDVARNQEIVALFKSSGVTISITAISQNLGISENDAKAKVNHLMSNRYLTGYKLQEDGTLVAIEKPKEKKQEENLLKLKKCPNCGANLTETADHKCKCKYCGVTFDK